MDKIKNVPSARLYIIVYLCYAAYAAVDKILCKL